MDLLLFVRTVAMILSSLTTGVTGLPVSPFPLVTDILSAGTCGEPQLVSGRTVANCLVCI